jgi:RES domain-containing protein
LIKVWRIVHERNAATAFSGEGSRKRGGRWNSRGYRAVYCAESLALATLELLVHGVPYDSLKHFISISVLIPEKLVIEIKANKLPSDWRMDPPPSVLQAIGDKWLEEKQYAVLKVPSAVIPVEFNYVINPDHPDFSKIGIGGAERHTFDVRLSKIQ